MSDNVIIVLKREHAEKLLADAPPKEFRADFQPQHYALLEALTEAVHAGR